MIKHNSLQHDSSAAMPLLEILVQAIKKRDSEELNEDLKKTAQERKEEEKDKIKDGALLLAERIKDADVPKDVDVPELSNEWREKIKQSYAGEMQQQIYAQSQGSYDASQAYGDTNTVMQNRSMINYSEPPQTNAISSEAQNIGGARLKDENSTAYQLSQGSKYQAFIMTDPKGRIHSVWNIIRIMNENQEGLLEQNNGLHYQGLS